MTTNMLKQRVTATSKSKVVKNKIFLDLSLVLESNDIENDLSITNEWIVNVIQNYKQLMNKSSEHFECFEKENMTTSDECFEASSQDQLLPIRVSMGLITAPPATDEKSFQERKARLTKIMRQKAAVEVAKKKDAVIDSTSTSGAEMKHHMKEKIQRKKVTKNGALELLKKSHENRKMFRKQMEQKQQSLRSSPAFKGSNGTSNSQSYDISSMYDSDDDDDFNSDIECDEKKEKDKGKYIPLWARKENLQVALDIQFGQIYDDDDDNDDDDDDDDHQTYHRTDPNKIFGQVKTCDLDAIFASHKKIYENNKKKRQRGKHQRRRRGSSGDWRKDGLTRAEQIAYKRDMGYI